MIISVVLPLPLAVELMDSVMQARAKPARVRVRDMTSGVRYDILAYGLRISPKNVGRARRVLMSVRPRVIKIGDRRTAIRLEDQFWFWLRQLAAEQGCTTKSLIEAVEMAKIPGRSLSSELRVYVTSYLHDHPLEGFQR